MEAKTTINDLFSGNRIAVPDYQRAYSWATTDKNDNGHVNTFLNDLLDYIKSGSPAPYYFGHFLFEQRDAHDFAVIDGQQRLTTISIFLSAAFRLKKENGKWDETEQEMYEDMVKRNSTYRFSTVAYDNMLMRDYVIDQTKHDLYGIKTTSGKRITKAYDYLYSQLNRLGLETTGKLVNAVAKAACTTHIVNSESEGIQMFIFQNNRGKKPSNLEIIKAQFMYNLHLYGGMDAESMIQEVKERFENIYLNISRIEDFVDEDDVLARTMQVYFNSLWRDNAMEEVDKALKQPDRLDFIMRFTHSLADTFTNLEQLLEDSKRDVDIESALLCGRYYIVLPFFIKAYSNGMESCDIVRMAKALGDLVLRDAIVGTRADMRSRLNDVFEKLGKSPNDVIGRINWMKTNENWWWHYWNNEELSNAASGNWYQNSHWLAKIVLWRYENHLIKSFGKGYSPILFNSIEKPHLEHIAPQTQNGEKEATGYDTYDQDFWDNYMYRLGNFLLLSAPHNESIGNKPFELKRSTYEHLYQQREIIEWTAEDHKWDKPKIAKRTEKLVDFLLKEC